TAPALAAALAPSHAALGWVDAGLFFDLLDAAASLGPAPDDLARRFGRAVIRSSFQRFFPASASTLTPERVVASFPVVWGKYHTWGRMRSILAASRATVTLEVPRRSPAFGPWVEAVVAQTVILCGGEDVTAAVAQAESRTLAVQVAWRGK